MTLKPLEVALGKELDWTEEEMDAFLVQSVPDLIQGEQLWEESVDPVFSDLLFAESDAVETSGA